MRDQDFAALGEHVQDAAAPPGFEVLERRGQRLRRQRAGAVAMTVAVATAGVVLATFLGASGPRDNSQPPVVSRSTASASASATATPPDDWRPGPEEIVTDPDAGLVALAVSSEEPDVRAAIWQTCGRHCFGPPYGLTVTDDGFTTSTYVAVPELGSFAYVQSVGDETFYLGGNRRQTGQLVQADGTVTQVQMDDVSRPLADGEVLVGSEYNQYLALNSRTAVSHPIDMPASQLLQAPDGRLWGVDFRSLVVSTDGGRTWTEHPLNTATNRPILHLIPSAVGGTLAVAEGADGATLFPFIQVHRSTDGGATWDIVQESTGTLTAYMEWAVVRPDGSLLVNLQNWSDDEAGNPSDRPHGLYESQGDAWADLAPADATVPGIKDPHAGWGWTAALLRTTVDAAGRQTLYVRDVEQRVFASTDGGRTWHAVAAR